MSNIGIASGDGGWVGNVRSLSGNLYAQRNVSLYACHNFLTLLITYSLFRVHQLAACRTSLL